jgi:hypothetical protein
MPHSVTNSDVSVIRATDRLSPCGLPLIADNGRAGHAPGRMMARCRGVAAVRHRRGPTHVLCPEQLGPRHTHRRAGRPRPDRLGAVRHGPVADGHECPAGDGGDVAAAARHGHVSCALKYCGAWLGHLMFMAHEAYGELVSCNTMRVIRTAAWRTGRRRSSRRRGRRQKGKKARTASAGGGGCPGGQALVGGSGGAARLPAAGSDGEKFVATRGAAIGVWTIA